MKQVTKTLKNNTKKQIICLNLVRNFKKKKSNLQFVNISTNEIKSKKWYLFVFITIDKEFSFE